MNPAEIEKTQKPSDDAAVRLEFLREAIIRHPVSDGVEPVMKTAKRFYDWVKTGVALLFAVGILYGTNAQADEVGDAVAKQLGQLIISNAQLSGQFLQIQAQANSLKAQLDEAMKICGDKCKDVGKANAMPTPVPVPAPEKPKP